MYQFEKITPLYIPLMACLHQASFEKPWKERDFSSLLSVPANGGFVCEKGFILCSICGSDAEVLTLCVDPLFRRQGIGLALLEYTARQLKKSHVESLFLEVNVFNKPAVLLYEKAGFERVGVRKNYYTTFQGKQDALVLQKKL